MPEKPESTPSPAEALRALFPNEPDRVHRLLVTLAREFGQHEADFAAAAGRTDQPALRALRHKLHSALIQLHLHELRQALDALVESPGNADLTATTAGSLRQATHLLKTAATATSAEA
jgi:HPt (histidine-containing phosphotransfer) domain-containing protein